MTTEIEFKAELIILGFKLREISLQALNRDICWTARQRGINITKFFSLVDKRHYYQVYGNAHTSAYTEESLEKFRKNFLTKWEIHENGS